MEETLKFLKKELELLNLSEEFIDETIKNIEEKYRHLALPFGQPHLPELIKVYKNGGKAEDTTDISLLVATSSQEILSPWDRAKIKTALCKEARLSSDDAEEIAFAVERKIFAADLKTISTDLVRALVDNELFIRGLTKKLAKQKILGIPTYDVKQIVYSKSSENSNIAANNPEAINLSLAETIIKQYLLQNVFSEEVAEAHLKGMIHIHDLGYPRAYCSGHSLDYIKKYGLDLETLNSVSKPATRAHTITGHLNTFLASMQAYYAGALGLGFFNIFYAPYLINSSDKELKQEAQYIIFSGSQNAFSRGSQTLFLDYNINLGVPSYIKNTPAIGPKGKYLIKRKNNEIEQNDKIDYDKNHDPIDPKNGHILRYGDFEKEAQRFARAMLEVWGKGDAIGQPFAFPKCDLHINEDTFSDPAQNKLFKYACEISAKNGAPYFIFDRGNEAILSQCCRLREKVTDPYLLKHLESLRFCGFQIVTINLPQAVYRTYQNGARTVKNVIKEIEKAMDLAIKAHFQKQRLIKELMSEPGLPMWQVGKIGFDGRPYVDLDKATYLIGMIGLNECVEILTGYQLHESKEAYKIGLEIIAGMNLKAKKLSQETGLKVTLEETPAESTALRLAKVDLTEYPESKDFVKGDKRSGAVYYTNSIHYAADAPIDIIERIEGQARFNPLIESGAITHCFVGEKMPSPSSIESLVKRTFYNTQSAQIVISPEFTVCKDCHHVGMGYMRR